MATINFRLRSNANKNVNIKIYLSTGRGNFIETNTGFVINPNNNIPEKWETDLFCLTFFNL